MDKITVKDLDTKICDFYKDAENTETFREYIRNSEEFFGMEVLNVDDMENDELNRYLDILDYLWEK